MLALCYNAGRTHVEKVADVIIGLVEAVQKGILSRTDLVKGVTQALSDHRSFLMEMDHDLDPPPPKKLTL